MPAIPTALALSLAAETVPEVAPDTLVAFPVQESRLNRTTIHDNTDGRSYVPTTVQEAVTLATALIQGQHHCVDLGVMQVNSADFMRLGLSIAVAFETHGRRFCRISACRRPIASNKSLLAHRARLILASAGVVLGFAVGRAAVELQHG